MKAKTYRKGKMVMKNVASLAWIPSQTTENDKGSAFTDISASVSKALSDPNKLDAICIMLLRILETGPAVGDSTIGLHIRLALLEIYLKNKNRLLPEIAAFIRREI